MVRAEGAFAAMRDFLPFFKGQKKHKTDKTLNGHATIIANSAYEKLLHKENWLRKLVPFSIISFLILIGFARGVQLYENRDATLIKASENLSLIADLVKNELGQKSQKISKKPLIHEYKAYLADAKPDSATRNGRILLLVDSRGYIKASEPATNGRDGIYLSDILEPTQPLLTFGKKAGVMSVLMVANGEPTLVTARHIENDFGTLITFQPKEAILEQWRSDVNLNTAIFLGTGILMLAVFYAFFTQTIRADEADTIYHQTYARFDTALHHGKCGLWDWDIARGRAFWSPSMYEILGLKPRQSLIAFGEFNELIHPNDTDMLIKAEKILAGEINQFDEIYRMRHVDGHWIWVRARGEVVRADQQENVHLVGICIDISEQIRLEQDHKTANTRLRDSIESLSEAFVLRDSKNRLIVCNEQFRTLNGLSSSAIPSGTPFEDVLREACTPQEAFKLTMQPLQDPNGRTFETELSDGRWLQIDERRTKDGGFVTIATDITTIKNNQENLRQRENELSTTVLNLEKSKRELLDLAALYSHQREIAEEANRIKAEFLANISHEWRTPLNAIIGFSELMEQGVLGPLGSDKYKEYCRDINKSGSYMLNFLDDVISMSEIESGQFKLQPLRVDAAEILYKTIASHEEEAERFGIKIIKDIKSPLILQADKRSLKQIFSNILSNALKFNHVDGHIFISCHMLKNDMHVSIKDDGIGISDNIISQLGTPFKQVQNQHTKNHTGSGLGLSISKSLVEMHNGSLNIKSEYGKGTEILIRIPI